MSIYIPLTFRDFVVGGPPCQEWMIWFYLLRSMILGGQPQPVRRMILSACPDLCLSFRGWGYLRRMIPSLNGYDHGVRVGPSGAYLWTNDRGSQRLSIEGNEPQDLTSTRHRKEETKQRENVILPPNFSRFTPELFVIYPRTFREGFFKMCLWDTWEGDFFDSIFSYTPYTTNRVGRGLSSGPLCPDSSSYSYWLRESIW